MKKKWFLNLSLFAILTTFLAFASCKDYDDDIKKIETGLSSLMSTVDELQQKIESGFAIIDVETTDNGVTIKLSDNKTYTLTNGTSGKEGSVITIGENGNWFIDDIDTKKTSKSTDGVYYMPGDDGFWQIIDGETVIPTTDSWFIESSVIAKWENGYVVLYNVEGSDGPITIGLVGLSKLVLIPHFVTDDSSLTPVINFSSLVTPCGEIAATTTLVKYQVSPNNASESLIDKENIFFKYNNPQSQSNALDLKPQAEFVSLE
ncbi:MAG TPA: PL29 family lyase N-terminal domain-containing protein, partial [Dysgonamonadaceae bacterium]|nr:PL29 family lyase N-terminal domain-containing protein [Dysgonamonadaceae bacterium]